MVFSKATRSPVAVAETIILWAAVSPGLLIVLCILWILHLGASCPFLLLLLMLSVRDVDGGSMLFWLFLVSISGWEVYLCQTRNEKVR